MTAKPVFFKLVFSKVDPNFPITQTVEIHARRDSTFERLTPKITESEFYGYIDHLIRELEHIRRAGKRRFAEAKNKIKL